MTENTKQITYGDLANKRYEIIATLVDEKCGAYETLGSYQGEWILITDKHIYIGYYGSCSVCDTLENIYSCREYEEYSTPEEQERILECVYKKIPITPEMYSMSHPELRIHLAKVGGETYLHNDDILESVAFYFYKIHNFSA